MRVLSRFAMGLCLVWSFPSFALNDIRVVWVAIDGVRKIDLVGKGQDEAGKPVQLPFMNRMKKEGVYFENVFISNPAGVSLPGYADMFAGRRQEPITSNSPPVTDRISHSPTLFEALRNQEGVSESDVMLLASWRPVCEVANSKGGEAFEKSCEWRRETSFKGRVFEDSRSDSDTFIEALRVIPEKKPRFVFLQLVDADEEAHLHKTVAKKAKVDYGMFHYHQALRQSDYYIGRLWDSLQAIPEYKGKTYLLVTTDHGRDSGPKGWTDHGNCLLCDSFKEIFALVMGPGLKRRLVKTEYSHIDMAPTVAKLLGVPFPTATGKVMTEIVGTRDVASPNAVH